MLIPIVCFGPMIMATLCYALGRKSDALRDGLALAVNVAVLALCALLAINGGEFAWPGFCGLGLNMRADGFRGLYALIAAFMWTMTTLFSRQYLNGEHGRGRYCFFNLMTLGATLGVFLSNDLYSTFIFFEIMSLTSYAWVAHEQNAGALRAAGTYLAVAVIGGLCTLMGLFMLYHELGTLSFEALRMAVKTHAGDITVPVWLTLAGFAAKAGLFPLHIWLPKAHPVAPAPASALLSGILTKSGIFGLIVICTYIMPGNAAFGNALLVLGAITMFLGAVLALFAVDLKRVLACSSMSQIGFIVVGLSFMVLLGEEGSLAAYGASLHMVNHSLIKLVLFMSAGAVFMNLHALNLNDIRGFGRGKPILHAVFLLGALSLGCIPPLGSGYISKSLLHESILEYIAELTHEGIGAGAYRFVEALFMTSGGLTIAYMTKLYICLFWQKHPTRQAEFDGMNGRYLTRTSAFALMASAVLLPLMGALPGLIMSPIGARCAGFMGQAPIAAPIAYFSWENLKGALISMAIGAAAYLLIVRLLLTHREGKLRTYADRWPKWLDLENSLYRPVLGIAARSIGFVTQVIADLPEILWPCLVQCATFTARFVGELPERIVLLAHSTIFRKRQKRGSVPVGNRFTYTLGCALNRISRALNATLMRRRPLRTDHEYALAEFWNALNQSGRRAFGSVSFGLLLLCIGLYITCAYLLMH